MDNAAVDVPAPEAGKLRQCLNCQQEFISNWSGHRICDRCKHKRAWREGVPAHSHSSSGNR